MRKIIFKLTIFLLFTSFHLKSAGAEPQKRLRMLTSLNSSLQGLEALRTFTSPIYRETRMEQIWGTALAELMSLNDGDFAHAEKELLRLATTGAFKDNPLPLRLICDDFPLLLNRLLQVPEGKIFLERGRLSLTFAEIIRLFETYSNDPLKTALLYQAIRRRIECEDLPQDIESLRKPNFISVSQKWTIYSILFARIAPSKSFDSILLALAERAEMRPHVFTYISKRLEYFSAKKESYKHLFPIIENLLVKKFATEDDLETMMAKPFEPKSVKADCLHAVQFYLKIFETASNERVMFSMIYRLSDLDPYLNQNDRARIRQRISILKRLKAFDKIPPLSSRGRDLYDLRRTSSRMPKLLFECVDGVKELGLKIYKKIRRT